jgi:NADPH-dependent curcumin reductase CurA
LNPGWEAYTVQPYAREEFKAAEWVPWTFNMDLLSLNVVENPGNAIRWTTFCGALGTPGLTAWAGFEEYVNAKEGETIFVSSGASGVGQYVINIIVFSTPH